MTESTLERRVDKMDKRLDELGKVLNEVYTDVKIIKSTCETRGTVCSEHFANVDKRVINIEDVVEGREKPGLKARVDKLEDKDTSKEKYLYLIIGALISAGLSLVVFLVQHLVQG